MDALDRSARDGGGSRSGSELYAFGVDRDGAASDDTHVVAARCQCQCIGDVTKRKVAQNRVDRAEVVGVDSAGCRYIDLHFAGGGCAVHHARCRPTA